MRVTIELFASFRAGRFKAETWERPDETTVADVIAELGIGGDQIGVVLVNRRHADCEQVLADGEVCAIFPAVGGG